MPKRQNTYEELVIKYLKYRNAFRFGYVNYGIFKNLIVYITDIKDKIIVRRIFQNLINKNLFDKVKNSHTCLYRFNPYDQEEDLQKKLIITFG